MHTFIGQTFDDKCPTSETQHFTNAGGMGLHDKSSVKFVQAW